MDLMRPSSLEQVQKMVQRYADAEPEALKRDFHNSLCAAYRPEEVREQLAQCGLETLQLEVVSDRHWIVWGPLPN